MKKNSQRGFSLLEMLFSIAILVAIMAAVLSQISSIQARYHTEEARLDTMEGSREFVDQIVRELHVSSYPNNRIFRWQYTGSAPYSLTTVAAGLVYASPYRIQFEADLDGSGSVQEVVYQLVDKNGALATDLSNCPCTLQRGQTAKLPYPPESPTQAAPVFTTSMGNVINPANQPLFSFYDSSGAEITSPSLPLQFNSTQSSGGAISTIETVRISVTVAGKNQDIQTHMKPEVSYTATAQVGR